MAEQLSPYALELLQVMVSENLPYPLTSKDKIGHLGLQLLKAGCVEIYKDVTPSAPFLTLGMNLGLIVGINIPPPLVKYFLVPTDKGEKYVSPLEAVAETG